MRFRKIATTLATTLATTAALVGVLAAPASAGTGASQACTDGIGWFSVGHDDLVTIALEVSYDPLNPSLQQVWLCYSTTSYGQPNAIAGGAIRVDVATDTGTTYPGVGVGLYCLPDSGVSVGPVTCFAGGNTHTAPFDVSTTPAGGTCLVALNGSCLAFIPGVAVYTNATPYPLLSITLVTNETGTVTLPVDQPAQCIGILTNC